MLTYLDKQYYRTQILFEKQQLGCPKNEILKELNRMIKIKKDNLSEKFKESSQKFRNISNQSFKTMKTYIHPQQLTKTAETINCIFNELKETNQQVQTCSFREDENQEMSYQTSLIAQRRLLLSIDQVYDKINSSFILDSQISKTKINLEEYNNSKYSYNLLGKQNINLNDRQKCYYIAYTDKPSMERSYPKTSLQKKKNNQHRPRYTQIHKSFQLSNSLEKHSKNSTQKQKDHLNKQQILKLNQKIKNRILTSCCTIPHLQYQTENHKNTQIFTRLEKEQKSRKNFAKLSQIRWK